MSTAGRLISVFESIANTDALQRFRWAKHDAEQSPDPEQGLAYCKARETVYKSFRRQYGDPIGTGANRAVFDTKDGFVVKVPLDNEAEENNRGEVAAYRSSKGADRERLAPAKLKTIGGVPVVVMVKVEHPTSSAGFKVWDTSVDEPGDTNWVNDIDAQQVGVHQNKLKAYDYGY